MGQLQLSGLAAGARLDLTKSEDTRHPRCPGTRFPGHTRRGQVGIGQQTSNALEGPYGGLLERGGGRDGATPKEDPFPKSLVTQGSKLQSL